MFPLCARELGDAFDIKEALHFGTLPGILNIRDPGEKCDFLYAYVETYLQEEITREAAVRQLQNYHRFLASIRQLIRDSSLSLSASTSAMTVSSPRMSRFIRLLNFTDYCSMGHCWCDVPEATARKFLNPDFDRRKIGQQQLTCLSFDHDLGYPVSYA